MEQRKDGWYRRDSMHVRYEAGKIVEANTFKTINKAKKANRETKYPVIYG